MKNLWNNNKKQGLVFRCQRQNGKLMKSDWMELRNLIENCGWSEMKFDWGESWVGKKAFFLPLTLKWEKIGKFAV